MASGDAAHIVARGETFKETGVKNKWRWEWCEKSVKVKSNPDMFERIGEHIRKLSSAGIARCELCPADIVYSQRGCHTLAEHLTTKKHQNRTAALDKNTTLSGHPLPEKTVYGAHPMFAKSVESPESSVTLLVPLQDRTQNAEAMVISFAIENNMALSAVPKIVDLAKALANDKLALQNMACSSTMASYKLKYGVAATFQQELVEELKVSLFSLNIDEAMNSNNEKVVSVLVSHFSESQQMVTVNHLSSFSLVKITSESLYKKLEDIFEELGLPWTNLLSVLMDSCAVMRGKKGGLETLIRTRKAPHLLDVDGDTIHHAHIAAKAFCKPFGHHLEHLLTDLHTDHKWSTHNRDLLADVCLALGIQPSSPKQYVSHRWLSLAEVVADTIRIMDALVVLYYSFLHQSDQKLFEDRLTKIFENRNVKKETKVAIRKIQLEAEASLKSGTKDGKERKRRITQKLFDFFDKTMLQLHLYITVLSILQKYVKIFQTKAPMMHELHTKQEELLKEYLQCFIRPEYLVGGPSQLLKLDLDNKAVLLPPPDVHLGSYVGRYFNSRRSDDPSKIELLHQAKTAFIAGGKKLLQKMPLNNRVIRCFSFLDPKTRGTSASQRELLKLPSFIPGSMSESEENKFQQEVRSFQTDRQVPELIDERIDTWWVKVDQGKYPVLKQLVKGVLSCFYGPLVESMFSIMGEVIDKSNTKIDIDTYSAMQTVKQALKAKGKTAVQYFKKTDPVKEPVGQRLVQNMLSAAKKDKVRKERNRDENAHKAESLGVTAKKLTTKRKATETILEEATQARIEHQCSLRPSTAADVSDCNELNSTPASTDCKKMKKQSSIGTFFNPILKK